MKKNIKLYIFASITLIFTVLTVVTFFAYIDVNKYNESIVLLDMELVGDEYMPAKIDVSFLSGKICTKGNESFYLAGDKEHIFVFSTTTTLNPELEKIKKYSYSVIDTKPENYRVIGESILIEDGLKEIALKAYNELFKENNIKSEQFEEYFGEYYLKDVEVYDNTESLKHILFITCISLLILFCIMTIICYKVNKN